MRRRSPAARFLTALAIVIVAASAGQLVRSDVALEQSRGRTERHLDAGDPCIGARAATDAAACPASHRLPAGFDPATVAEDIGIVEKSVPFLGGCANVVVDGDPINKHCVWDRPSAAATVVLVGDSHVAHWADAVREIAERRDWNVEVYYRGGCAPADDGDRRTPTARRGCEDWNERVAGELRTRTDVDLVIVGSRMSEHTYQRGAWWDIDPAAAADAMVAATVRFVSGWAAAVPDVVIVRDTPDPGRNVPECLDEASRAAGGGSVDDPCTVTTAIDPALEPWDAKPIDDDESGRVATELGIPLLDFSEIFCDPLECHTVVGGISAYRDDDHMTLSFARTIGRLVEERLDAVTDVP